MGEFDMVFGDSNLTFIWPNKTSQVFDVATTGYYLKLTDSISHKSFLAVSNQLGYLKHTIAQGFATKMSPDSAPYSFKDAMDDHESTAFVMWKCNGINKAQCDFSATTTVEELRDVRDQDACNHYPDCHSCITAHEGDVKCGWCQGGNLTYKGAGLTKFKCGGYKDDEPYKFTCPRAFKTEDCKGYVCDYTNYTCTNSTQGQFPDEASCKASCVSPKWKKCNHETKKCEDCKQGTEGCNTDAYCQASCSQPLAKCNTTTGKCAEC